jgi:hypothetical protein
MDAGTAVLSAERSFFSSLITADVAVLDALLADDFLLIDVLRHGPQPVHARVPQAGRIVAFRQRPGDADRHLTAIVTGGL